MNRQLDIEAVVAVRAGDMERYGELVERHQRSVYGIAWSRLGDPHLCDEVLQETFLRAFRFLRALRRPEKFGPWIARIARNVSTELGCRRRRELDCRERWRLDRPEQMQDGASVMDDETMHESLRRSMVELPDAHRESLVLFYMEGRSIREAAARLGISENTFKTRLHRARTELRGRMEARIEESLRGMEPDAAVKRNVLAAIPFLPMAGGKTLLGGILLLPQFALLCLAPKVPFFVFLGWALRSLARNYCERGAFRRKLTMQNYFRLVALMVPWILLTHWGVSRFGYRALYCFLSVYLLPGLLQGLILLRINRTAFVKAQVVGLTAMGVSSAAMGLFGLSFLWFAAAMLVFNVSLFLARKSQPYRQDYNLFVRAATGGLVTGTADQPANPVVNPQTMRAFALFLGNRFLISDYMMRAGQYIFFLPPVANDLVSSFLLPVARLNGSSRVTMSPDGACLAQIAARDLASLQRAAGPLDRSSSELAEQVAGVFREALVLLQSGNQAAAAGVLEAEPDAAVFRRAPYGLRSQRIVYAASILAALLMLIVLASQGHMSMKPIPFSVGRRGADSKPTVYHATAVVHAVIGRSVQDPATQEGERLGEVDIGAATNRPVSVWEMSAEDLRKTSAVERDLLRAIYSAVATRTADKFEVVRFRYREWHLIIDIRVASDDPQRAADLCNIIAKRYATTRQGHIERQIAKRAHPPNVRGTGQEP